MKKEIDLTQGNLLKKLLLLMYPMIITNIIQKSYNLADILVIGRFSGSDSLAAVGATAFMVCIVHSLFSGVSVAVNIIISRFYGAKDNKRLSDAVHTSVAATFYFSVFFTIVVMFFSKKFLVFMNTPENILDKADVYMKIYFLGLPAMFVSASQMGVLRAIGNTRSPMYYSSFSGIINVILNVILVAIFKLDVTGVALSTTISQFIVLFLCTRYLLKCDGSAYQLKLSKIKIDFASLKELLFNAIPVSIQATLCSIGGTLIQASLNLLGADALAATSAAQSIQGIVNCFLSASYLAIYTAISQNFGAKNEIRIKKTLCICILYDIIGGLIIGLVVFALRYQLMGIFVTKQSVIELGVVQLVITTITLFLCGVMDILFAFFRGMGMKLIPIIVTILGQFGIRVVWSLTVCKYHNSFIAIVLVDPVIWVATIFMYSIIYVFWRKRMYDKMHQL